MLAFICHAYLCIRLKPKFCRNPVINEGLNKKIKKLPKIALMKISISSRIAKY